MSHDTHPNDEPQGAEAEFDNAILDLLERGLLAPEQRGGETDFRYGLTDAGRATLSARPRYSVGRLLKTAATRQWSPGARAQAEAAEQLRVFRCFTADDEGQARELVCLCREPRDAQVIADALNELPALRERVAELERGADQKLREQFEAAKADLIARIGQPHAMLSAAIDRACPACHGVGCKQCGGTGEAQQ